MSSVRNRSVSSGFMSHVISTQSAEDPEKHTSMDRRSGSSALKRKLPCKEQLEVHYFFLFLIWHSLKVRELQNPIKLMYTLTLKSKIKTNHLFAINNARKCASVLSSLPTFSRHDSLHLGMGSSTNFKIVIVLI